MTGGSHGIQWALRSHDPSHGMCPFWALPVPWSPQLYGPLSAAVGYQIHSVDLLHQRGAFYISITTEVDPDGSTLQEKESKSKKYGKGNLKETAFF